VLIANNKLVPSMSVHKLVEREQLELEAPEQTPTLPVDLMLLSTSAPSM